MAFPNTMTAPVDLIFSENRQVAQAAGRDNSIGATSISLLADASGIQVDKPLNEQN